jgi:hypothetical protein
MDTSKCLNKKENKIIFNDSNFKISQIIIGNVQLDSKPNNSSLAFCLHHFDFVSAKCSVTLIEKYNSKFKMLVDCASPFEKKQLFDGFLF